MLLLLFLHSCLSKEEEGLVTNSSVEKKERTFFSSPLSISLYCLSFFSFVKPIFRHTFAKKWIFHNGRRWWREESASRKGFIFCWVSVELSPIRREKKGGERENWGLSILSIPLFPVQTHLHTLVADLFLQFVLRYVFSLSFFWLCQFPTFFCFVFVVSQSLLL